MRSLIAASVPLGLIGEGDKRDVRNQAATGFDAGISGVGLTHHESTREGYNSA